MKFTIARKILLMLIMPFLTAILLLGTISLLFLTRIQADVSFTNVAGGQRMLSEQMGKYALLVHEGGQRGGRRELASLIRRFDGSLRVLRRGGQLPESAVELPPPPEQVVAALNELAGLWMQLRPNLEVIATLAQDEPRARRAWKTVDGRVTGLTEAANRVVMAFVTYHGDLRRRMVLLLALNALFTLLLCLAGNWAVRRYLVEPMHRLRDAAEAVRTGHYVQRVEVRTRDELADLADTFNAMARDVAVALRTERELRARQANLAEAIIALGADLATEPLLHRVGELGREITGARYAMLGHMVNGEKRFVPVGMSEEELAPLRDRAPEGRGLLGLLWDGDKVVRIDDIAAHPDACGFPPDHPPMRTFLGAAIEFGGVARGALYLADKNGGEPFTAADEQIVATLAAACAVALANAASHEALITVNRDLDQRVSERTKALNKANALLRNREVELELMNEELIRTNEAKNQFLANTSHELRTPLNAIIGFSDLLLSSRALSERQRIHAAYINEGGRTLLVIINNLLDLSKIEAGAMEIQEEICSPGALLDQVSSSLAPLVEKKAIECSVRRPEHDLSVCADAGKLRQVLTNLMGNAIKFTGEGGRVDVGLDVVRADGELMLDGYVRDNGIGIAREDQRRIFEPFVQAEGSLTRGHGGTGLGLPLSRRLVHLLGGDLALESDLGEGSCFTFRVSVRPVEALHPEEMMVQQQAEGRPAEEIADQPISVPAEAVRPCIVVVDEDEPRAAAVVKMLDGEGYEGVVVDLQHIETEVGKACPFAILVGIPDDPVEIYARLRLLRARRGTSRVPLLLLGGDAGQPRFSFGTVDNVTKEFSQNELMDLISQYGRHLPARAHGPVVLVVDDEASVREYLRATLVHEGYRVLQAASGEQGVRLAVERDPDLIILDLMMPGMSGFDVVERLKRHPTACDIPVVIFTARELTREEVMRLGQEVEKVLVKGVSGFPEIVRELRGLELLYPVQARLVDAALQIYNSRYLDLRLVQECHRAARYGQRFSIAGWQVDGFDDYVTVHGLRWAHTALKEMMETVAALTRKGDVLMRMTEARFALLLPGITPTEAERAAEKLLIRIRHQHFSLPGAHVGRFTASFGLAHYGIDAEDKLGLVSQLHTRIDQAFAAGGDRCVREEG